MVSKLSESLLWPLGKKAYARFGIDCWNINAVPFHITSNSRIAVQYARIASAAYKGELMTFLELGGGSGKFAYLFLSELLKLGVSSFRYILTDFAEKNVDFWNAHPLFLPYIEQGLLCTAVFDPLATDSPPYVPDIVIANYLFGSIPQDLFRVEAGRIFEARVALEVDEKGTTWDDPEILSKIRDTYTFELLEGSPYIDFPEAATLLEDYRNKNIGTFLFPIGACRLLRRLRSFCKPGFLLLAADRGPWTEEQLSLQPPPQISHHKTVFSFPVNFHAIRRFVEIEGGETAFPIDTLPAFGAGLFSFHPIEPAVKEEMIRQHFGPLETVAIDPSQILDRLDEANWDATLFFFFFDRLSDIGEEGKQRLLAGMRSIIERFFPLFREEACLLDQLGFLFQALGEAGQAQRCFEAALQFQMLPRQASAADEILVFLKEHKPVGDVLQLGGGEQISAAIRSYGPKTLTSVSWNRASEASGEFNRIYLFPPTSCFARRAKKPRFIREIEEQFPSLESNIYSDQDIDVLLLSLTPSDREQHALHFFSELKRKNQITAKQLTRVLQQLGLKLETEVQEESQQVFEILKRCLDRHWKAGAMLKCFLPKGSSLYDDPQIFDTIIVDPNLHFEEKDQVATIGDWASVCI